MIQKMNEIDSKSKFATILLSVTYMSIIVSIMTLPSTLNIIDNDNTIDRVKSTFSSVSGIIGVATMVTMMGKFIFGPITDRIGGNSMLIISMSLISLCLAFGAWSTSFNWFSTSWILISFFYSSTWGAVGSIIRVSLRDCN